MLSGVVVEANKIVAFLIARLIARISHEAEEIYSTWHVCSAQILCIVGPVALLYCSIFQVLCKV